MARPTITIPPSVPSTPLPNGNSGYGFPAAESPGRAGSESPPPEGTQGALEMELLGLAHALYALGTTAVLDATRDAGSTASSPNNPHNHAPVNGNSAATQGKPVGARANDVVRALAAVDKMSDEFGRVMVPLDVLREVDAGQNPGRVSAARLERAVGENQFMNGKISAVQDYARELDEAIIKSYPELAQYLMPGTQNEPGEGAMAQVDQEMVQATPMENGTGAASQ